VQNIGYGLAATIIKTVEDVSSFCYFDLNITSEAVGPTSHLLLLMSQFLSP